LLDCFQIWYRVSSSHKRYAVNVQGQRSKVKVKGSKIKVTESQDSCGNTASMGNIGYAFHGTRATTSESHHPADYIYACLTLLRQRRERILQLSLKRIFSGVHNDFRRPPGAVAAFSRFRRREISDFTYLLKIFHK